MKATSTFLLYGLTMFILTLAWTHLLAQNACPVNFIGGTIPTAKADINNWNGKIIACEAKVVQIEKGYRNKLYYKIKFEDGGELWVGSLTESSYEKLGATLRLLGYLSKITKDDRTALKLNKNGFHLLAFAVIDMTSKQMSMLPGTDIQVKEWINGSVPKEEK
jgi:hypothetical protein